MIIRHQRRLNRLKNFDYSKNGYYFVTVCIDKRKFVFGEIKDKKMILNKYGKIINRQLLWLEKQYPYIKLDAYQIMPNHIHGIIVINKNFIINKLVRKIIEINYLGIGYISADYITSYIEKYHVGIDHVGTGHVGTGLDLSLPSLQQFIQLRQQNLSKPLSNKFLSLSNIIGAFKTTSSKLIHRLGLKNFRWQRSFYDHIIRNEKSLSIIRQYIKNNSANWDKDEENLGTKF